jgi:hypothetical protein
MVCLSRINNCRSIATRFWLLLCDVAGRNLVTNWHANGAFEKAYQDRVAAFQAESPAGATGPQPSRGRDYEFHRQARLQLFQTQSARLGFLEGHKLEEQAMIKQQPREVLARVLDGQSSFAPRDD